MTEPKAKVNGIHEPEKTQQQTKLRQLLALAKEVSKDTDAIQEYEKSTEGRIALEQELETKKSEVQRLREFNDKVTREYSDYRIQAKAKEENIFSEFEQRYKRYDANNAAVETMEKEVAEAKERLSQAEDAERKMRDKVESLKTKLETRDAKVLEQSSEIKSMREESDGYRACVESGIVELDACKTKLTEAESNLGAGVLKDYTEVELRELGLSLLSLSQECHSLVREYCNDVDGAKDSVSEIQDLKSRFPKVPLTTATTQPAARIRCAIAEAIIADILTKQIFVPFYLPNGKKEAAASLLDIFGDNEHLRSMYRCQVLRAADKDAEESRRVEEDIVRKASSEVKTTLHPLVVASKQAGFFAAVPPLFRKALRLWAEVQRGRELIVAEQPDPKEVQPPGRYEDYDSQQQGKAAGKQSIAAVLFPQVATREDIVFNGMALWSSQTAVSSTSYPPLSNGMATNGEGGKPGHNRRKSVVSGDMPALAKGRQVLNGS